MAKSRKHIQPGDQFMRTGKVQTLWEVTELLEFHDLPPHLRLKAVGEHRILTFAVAAVQDDHLFKPVHVNGNETFLAGQVSKSSERVNSLFRTPENA